MYAEAGLSPKTCNLRLTAVRSLLEYASEEFIDVTPVFTGTRTVKGVRPVQGPIEYFERDVMSALLAAPNVGKRTERRNRMLLIFLYDTAARVSEALNVRLCDLHTDAEIPYVTFFGKGRKYRNVPLMAKTSEHLKKYIGEFHELRDDTGTPLFFTVTHGILHRLSVDTPRKDVKKICNFDRIVRSCARSCPLPYDPKNKGDAPLPGRCASPPHSATSRTRGDFNHVRILCFRHT
jgi:site-specific recombinase XerD